MDKAEREDLEKMYKKENPRVAARRLASMEWIVDAADNWSSPDNSKKPEIVCHRRAAATYSKIEAPSAATSAIMA